jgi:hypothetical protein
VLIVQDQSGYYCIPKVQFGNSALDLSSVGKERMASGPSTHNKWLKVATKLILRKDNLVHFVKAIKIALQAAA